jgi:Cu-Zn family superoxide dismutase
MKKTTFRAASLALAAAGLSLACAQAAEKTTTDDMASYAHANLMGLDGKSVGTATFHETSDGVMIMLDVSGLTPGAHAVHIHETGKCDAAMKFTSAGGHFNPTMKTHGKDSAMPMHAGDMDNQTADASGHLKAMIVNKNITLATGPTSVFDSDGSAIVIHAKADDYKSQPAGDAGDRVVCGVIERGRAK